MRNKSQDEAEIQTTGASQLSSETPNVRASHGGLETPVADASHDKSETQAECAPKEKAKPLRPRKYPELHVWQRMLYESQKVRIATADRVDQLHGICATCKRRIGNNQNGEQPACECESPHRILGVEEHTHVLEVAKKITEPMERAAEKEIERLLKEVPVFEWLSGIKGCGPRLAGSLIAMIDPVELFPNISKLWAYAGVDPTRDGYAHNWGLKCIVCEKLPSQFIKQGKFYRALYDDIKARYKELHPEPVDNGKRTKAGKVRMDYTPMHIERMTRRKLGKIFLGHLWLIWRVSEDLPITTPWILGVGGHSKFIEPPESPE